MNKEGGTLIIGVEDDGSILGLDCDYNSFSKRNDKDKFSQHLNNVLNESIGIENTNIWKERFMKINENEICIIEVEKSSDPVFTNFSNKEEFYVRSGSTTNSLNPRKTHEYITKNF